MAYYTSESLLDQRPNGKGQVNHQLRVAVTNNSRHSYVSHRGKNVCTTCCAPLLERMIAHNTTHVDLYLSHVYVGAWSISCDLCGGEIAPLRK